MFHGFRYALFLLGTSMTFGLGAACSSSTPTAAVPAGGEEAGTTSGTGDPSDVPIDGVTAEQLPLFDNGDVLFGLPLREPDGLGPLYTRPSCGACHTNASRGPGLVEKMSVVLADGITPDPDQSKLPFGHTVHALLAGGGKTPIVPPVGDPTVKVSYRVGPPVLGRGYIEAVLDSEIERMEREQAARPGTIHGRINHVIYASENNPDTRFHTHHKGDTVIGRFGMKARVATLDDFTADALQGDMGLTSPLRPAEFPNPDGLTDDLKPGIDVDLDGVNTRAMYLRLIAIPKRVLEPRGRALFDQVQCSGCHTPSLHTRSDYPIAQLADKDAPIFSDLLLHDMGDALADGSADGLDGEAHSRDWRTTALIGLRFNKDFLHDSRAHDLTDAILMHDGAGSEASDSVHAFQALSPDDRATLLMYVGAL